MISNIESGAIKIAHWPTLRKAQSPAIWKGCAVRSVHEAVASLLMRMHLWTRHFRWVGLVVALTQESARVTEEGVCGLCRTLGQACRRLTSSSRAPCSAAWLPVGPSWTCRALWRSYWGTQTGTWLLKEGASFRTPAATPALMLQSSRCCSISFSTAQRLHVGLNVNQGVCQNCTLCTQWLLKDIVWQRYSEISSSVNFFRIQHAPPVLQISTVEQSLDEHLKEVRRKLKCSSISYVALIKDTHLLEVPEAGSLHHL